VSRRHPAHEPNSAALIAGYAPRFHSLFGDAHHVASPLGTWLLLALVAPLAAGADREELERALGCDAEDARRTADALLRTKHPSVSAAIAIWSREGTLGPALEAWSRALPPPVSVGALPTAAETDAWARRHTNGLIERFPIPLDELTRLVLGSAVATDLDWIEQFDPVEASELGGPWASTIRNAMVARGDAAQAVARTEAAGLVGVHVARSRQGLAVVSVIGEPGVPVIHMIAAGHEVAALWCARPSPAEFISLFDLPLQGHAWEIKETECAASEKGARYETAWVWIPAWSASARADNLLAAPVTGVAAAARSLVARLPLVPEGYKVKASQVLRTEFDLHGFRAAAVTVMDIELTGAPPPEKHRGLWRNLELRFARPFVAVAVVADDGGGPAWTGMPLFSAWITEPSEPTRSVVGRSRTPVVEPVDPMPPEQLTLGFR